MTNSYIQNDIDDFNNQAKMREIVETFGKPLDGYSELNLLLLWAESDEEGFMRHSGISLELLKAMIEAFRSRK